MTNKKLTLKNHSSAPAPRFALVVYALPNLRTRLEHARQVDNRLAVPTPSLLSQLDNLVQLVGERTLHSKGRGRARLDSRAQAPHGTPRG